MAELQATILARVDELLAHIKADIINTVRAEINIVKDDIDTVKDQIAAMKNDIGDIKIDVQAMRTDIEQIRNSFRDIERKQGLTRRLVAIVCDLRIYLCCASIDVRYSAA